MGMHISKLLSDLFSMLIYLMRIRTCNVMYAHSSVHSVELKVAKFYENI